jgi:aminopeptidase-like protein
MVPSSLAVLLSWPPLHQESAALERELYEMVARLYPLPRSLTGCGVRQTLQILQEWVPLAVEEVPSGTPVFDWEVPREWRVREAYLLTPRGERIADFKEHNLHLVGYSTPFRGKVTRTELMAHLHSLPTHPDWIPYRTSYWRETWGFCLPHRVVETLPEGNYEVVVDTELFAGSLTYGELHLPGETAEEILFSTHICHPSLANDNLSGVVVSAALARELILRSPRRFSYRFLFVPGTIGALTWLARNEALLPRIQGGLVLAGLGGPGSLHFKKTKHGQTWVDRSVPVALRSLGEPFEVEDFVPFGYDERQYNSPGIGLAMGCLSRTPWGRYPEYHTSADNLSFVTGRNLLGALKAVSAFVEVAETNELFENLSPKGEPMLGKRGLYRSLSGDPHGRERELALLWLLSFSDGKHDLLAIAERSKLPWPLLAEGGERLLEAGLLRPLAGPMLKAEFKR